MHSYWYLSLVKVQGDACLSHSHIDVSFIYAKQADKKIHRWQIVFYNLDV